jgi:predicted DNA-binding transcriptional regulator YafY
MPPLVLDDEEAVAIAVGLRAAAGAAVVGIEDTSLRALAKLEQVLPNRLRRRVNAVHSNVVAMRWGSGGPTIDAEALAVLAQACRDHEQVRFDYKRRDGAEERRLVEPHQLVSAGRRWYLVAWDVRRGDWRTFRVDRLETPQLAGVRFEPHDLPGGDAAAFVAQSIHNMPMAFEATVLAHGSADEVRTAIRWTDAEVDAVDDATCRVHFRADNMDWLLSNVTMLAVVVDIDVEVPSDLAPRVAELAARLGRAVAPAS